VVGRCAIHGRSGRPRQHRGNPSEKTIETHMTRVFQKLGLRSRVQVAAAVVRPD
jgi:ATP/maltotriose-dependent transcriptional regulator MalT